MSRINSLTYGVGFLLVVAFGCQPGEAPAPEYTYIYSEAPRPPSSANDLSLAGSPSMGAEDALITVIESSDFECPFCSRVVPTMKQLLEKNPDVRVVFKHNPLSFHKRALPAAIASMAAHEQGKFWEYHDLLFAGKRFSDNDLKGYAQQLGLDMPRFEADLQDPRLREKVLHDQKTMVSGGAGGTPAFFINGKLLSGAKPLRAFQAEVDAARLEAQKLASSGTTGDALVKAVFSTNVNPSFAASLVDGSPVTGRTPPKRPQKKPTAVDSKPVEIEIDSSDPVQGKEDAKVTVAIFSDFECPFCSKLVPTMERIREEYGEDVRFVFKQHPLSFHKNARLAAKASLAANQQGKFWEYHDVLFANQRALKRDQLIGYADQLGLDREKFIAHMDSPEAEAAVKEDMLAAQKIGVRGTPHSFINGVRLKGAKPYAAFEAEIAKVLGKKKGLNDAAAPTTGKVGLGEARGGVPTAPSVLVQDTGAAEATLFLDLQDPFSARVFKNALDGARKAGWKGKLRVAPLTQNYHEESLERAVALLARKESSPRAASAFLKAVLADTKTMGGAKLEKLAKRSGLGASMNTDAWSARMKSTREKLAKRNVIVSPTLFVSGGRYTAEGGFEVDALKTLFEGKVEVKR